MKSDSPNVDPSKYVVLDVETNGLSSVRDDLLSISIYKPDTGEMYNRFLPLELNSEATRTEINGITTSDLKNCLPLTQDEVDELIHTYELKERTILTYGNVDERFMVKYFQRHHLYGIEYFAFYNFKHEIISSRFSEGNITKDNLCRLYGVDNVQSVHSGHNDCVLEWQLFMHMNGHRLLVTQNKVFEFNDEYIVPVSYITTYTNMKYYLPSLPKITCEEKNVFSLTIPADGLTKYQSDFNGMILEHLINSMLHVKKVDSRKELLENKKKLQFIGELPSEIDVMPMAFNPDGSVTAIRPQDEVHERNINTGIQKLKEEIKPLMAYISNEIFPGEEIKSQELMVHPDEKILAICDLSSDSAVLEIKAASASIQNYKEQLYYEAGGRRCFLLRTQLEIYPFVIKFTISEVFFSIQERVDLQKERTDKAKAKIETDDVALLSYTGVKMPVKVKCKKCGNEWVTSYYLALKHRPCPECRVERMSG